MYYVCPFQLFSRILLYFILCFVLCVLPAGQFDIPEGIVFSMPVKFENGTWVVLTDLEDISLSEKTLNRLTGDLIQVMAEGLQRNWLP